jgi:hypothetical protein
MLNIKKNSVQEQLTSERWIKTYERVDLELLK